MEPITTGLIILGSKDILLKILGPTADYVGSEMKGFVEKCNINLDRIFVSAKNKLGEKLDEEGEVSPRVFKHVIDEGRFCEDELTAEYYGGVLASSKSKISRDDRGVTLLSIVKELSVYQLRLHYLFYHIFKMLGEANSKIGLSNERAKNRIFIPYDVYLGAMEFSEDEDKNSISILTHSIYGMRRHDLAGEYYQMGDQDYMQKFYKDCPPNGGIILEPTVFGAELFLWAEGKNQYIATDILDNDVVIDKPIVSIAEGSTLTNQR